MARSELKKTLERLNKKFGPKVRLAASIAGELSKALPPKDATKLQKAVSFVYAADQVYKAVKGGRDATTEYVQRFGLVSERSEPFVSLFFDSDMCASFSTRRFELTKYEEGYEAISDSGRLFFVLPNFGDSKARAVFYRSKDFDMQLAVDAVWEAQHGRLAAEIVALEFGDTKTKYYSFPEPTSKMFGSAPERLRKLVERHRSFQVDGIPRSYCFFGPPGTGKTSFADRFAGALGTRTLRLDASGFVTLSSRDLGFLVGILKPDFLIVDDADKAGGGHGTARLLALLERFKHEHPKTTFVMTANNTTGFDPGFLRPERIDEWHEFKLPDRDERKAIFESYLEGSKLRPDQKAVETIIDSTEGLSQDYLREFAQLAERVPLAEVLSSIAMKKRLLLAAQHAGGPSGSLPPTPKEG